MSDASARLIADLREQAKLYPMREQSLLERAAEALEAASRERAEDLDQTRKTVEFHRDMAARFAEDLDVQKHRAREAEARLRVLRGAIDAQDERERIAGEACGVLKHKHGCDWPDAVAESMQELVVRLRAVEQERDGLRTLLNIASAQIDALQRVEPRTFTTTEVQQNVTTYSAYEDPI